ncbi:MAG: leucyl/phenylalanyl-tRNA--protein transferase, partial [Spirochaetota bacterium]
LALGGDLSSARLLDAYAKGIFPWYEDDQPIIWHSPDPRFVLFPEKLAVSKSMRQVLSRKEFTITMDRCFSEVISACSMPRRTGAETWITHDMKQAYCRLHREGYAHSVEAWHGGELAGGLYGVSLGSVFFGESMFARRPNASKAAFITLVRFLAEKGFTLIDSQVYTAHLESLGAESISRGRYLFLLAEALSSPALRGSWSSFLQEN